MWMMRAPLSEPAKEDMPSVAHATAAARRRQRRLRQFLRHERLTVAMLLADSDHQTAPRGQKQATSGEEVRVTRRRAHSCATDGEPAGGFAQAPSISRSPSRLPKCPRSRRHPVFLARCSARRRWRSSLWKCQLSCLFLRSSSRLPSRILTFSSSASSSGEEVEVFKVFPQNRIQLRQCPSRSLTFQFAVEVFQVLPQVRVQQLPHLLFCMTMQVKEFKGVFALFSEFKKVRGPAGR